MPWEKNFNVDDVLEKAMQAFWARGYAATSMQDLVDRTGVNRASLYATYGDKRDLFIAALDKYENDYCRRSLAALESGPSPRAAISSVFRAYLEPPKNNGYMGCFLTNTALELAAHDKEIGRMVARGQEDFEAFFTRMIDAGKKKGEIAKKRPTVATARALLSSLLGLAVLARSRPQPELLSSIAEDALSRLG